MFQNFDVMQNQSPSSNDKYITKSQTHFHTEKTTVFLLYHSHKHIQTTRDDKFEEMFAMGFSVLGRKQKQEFRSS